MAISDAQFDAWLISADAQPCVLIEQDYVKEVAGAPVTATLHLSVKTDGVGPFVTGGTDTPANTPYDDLVVTAPKFAQTIDRATLSGEVSGTYAVVTLNNGAGHINPWTSYAIDGSATRVLYGDRRWPRGDGTTYFRTFFSAMGAAWHSRGTQTDLILKDASSSLAKRVGGEELIGGTGQQAKVPRPIPIGAVHNMKLEQKSLIPLLYVYGPSNVVAVSPTGTQFPVYVREGGNDIAGSWINNGDGTITLSATPTFEITADVFRPRDSLVLDTFRISDLLYILAAEIGGLSTLWYGAHSTYTARDEQDFHSGVLIKESTLIKDLVSQLAASANAFYGHRSDNTFQFGRIFPYNPTGSAVMDLGDDDRKRGADGRSNPADIEFIEPKWSQVNCRGDKNWNPQTNLTTLLAADLRARYEREGLSFSGPDPDAIVATTYAAAPWRYHKSMQRSEVIETLISSPFQGDADGELSTFARNEFTKWLPWVCLHSATWQLPARKLEIGDIVNLTDAQHALSGVRAQVISRGMDLQNKSVDLTLAYRNGPNASVTDPGNFLLQEASSDYRTQEDGFLRTIVL